MMAQVALEEVLDEISQCVFAHVCRLEETYGAVDDDASGACLDDVEQLILRAAKCSHALQRERKETRPAHFDFREMKKKPDRLSGCYASRWAFSAAQQFLTHRTHWHERRASVDEEEECAPCAALDLVQVGSCFASYVEGCVNTSLRFAALAKRLSPDRIEFKAEGCYTNLFLMREEAPTSPASHFEASVVQHNKSSEQSGSTCSPPGADVYQMRSIGSIHSVFSEKFGTPRQSGLVPKAVGCWNLATDIDLDAIEGLEQWSHVWLVFLFNFNTNKSVKAKVKPPRFSSNKLGVFATRRYRIGGCCCVVYISSVHVNSSMCVFLKNSPHRYNPIGQTVAHLLKIDKLHRRVWLGGIDLVDGTILLDIKPYHPADAILDAKHPGWVNSHTALQEHPALRVHWVNGTTVPACEGAVDTYYASVAAGEGECDEAARHNRALIEQVISQDPRSLRSREHAESISVFGVGVSGLDVAFKVRGRNALVFSVTPAQPNSPKLRTKEWLESLHADHDALDAQLDAIEMQA
jgi:tRNA (Thr-GGU) A37 N-methylase